MTAVTAVVKVADATIGSNNTAVTSVVCAKPANVAVGDVLVAMLVHQAGPTPANTNGSIKWRESGTTDGWFMPSEPTFFADGNVRTCNFLLLSVTSSNIGSLPSSWTFVQGYGTGRVNCTMVAVSGLDQAHLTDQLGVTWGTDVSRGHGNGSVKNSPNWTLSGKPAIDGTREVIGFCYHYAQFTSGNVNGVTTEMPGWTKIAESNTSPLSTNSRTNMVSYYKHFAKTDGAVAGATMVWAATAPTNPNSLEIFLPIAEAPDAPDAGPGVPVKYAPSNGTLDDAKLRVLNSDSVWATPVLRVIKPGAPTVADMLAAPVAESRPFVVAHRGGSVDGPEHAAWTFMRSAMAGVDAMEISLARSSDGVYFGLHDASLDRTTLGTGGGTGTTYVAASMTWAAIQALVNKDPKGQRDRAYMRWEDMIEQFGSSHVLFVDPKVIPVPDYHLIIDMMDAAGGPTRCVGKYYGVSGGTANAVGGWARNLADRGYERWGYFYDTDSANYDAYQGRWSILGMNYNAPQTNWDSILSYGKPVIGHITPTNANAQTALDKGATGIMASGPVEVLAGSLGLLPV